MRYPTFEYSDCRRVCYGEGATFIPVCEKCGRFVKADEIVRFDCDGQLVDPANATCKKCGRIKMIFEGYV